MRSTRKLREEVAQDARESGHVVLDRAPHTAAIDGRVTVNEDVYNYKGDDLAKVRNSGGE
jgi:hypothetical protein